MIKKLISAFSTHKNPLRLFLFPGQGTQEVGMLSGLPQKDKEEALRLAQDLLGINLKEIAENDSAKVINQTQITQPLLLVSHYLHFRAKGYQQELNQKDWMIGHSLGQYSALVNSGSLSLEEGLKLVHLRGSLMKKYTTSPHGMLIVKFKPEKQQVIMAEIDKSGLQIACKNTPTSITIAGPSAELQPFVKVLKQNQAVALMLPVSTAFHCKMLEGMKDEFRTALQKVSFEKPRCHVLRNYDCQEYVDQNGIRQGLVLQLTNPVLFSQSVEKVPPEAHLIEPSHKVSLTKFAQQVRKAKFLNSLI